MPPEPSPATRPPIQGWLLVFVAHGLLIVCANGYLVMRDSYRTLVFSHSNKPSIHALMAFPASRLVTSWLIVVVFIAGLSLIAARSSQTTRYWRFGLLLCVAIAFARLGITVWEHNWLLANPVTPSTQVQPSAPVVSWPYTAYAQVIAAGIALIWYLYWKRSVRVSNTFNKPANEQAMAAA